MKKARGLDALVQKVGQLVEQHLRLAPDTQTDALQTALRNSEAFAPGGRAGFAVANLG